MIYKEMALKDGVLIETSSKEIDQSKLTSDCWLIQINGLKACEKCKFLNTEECGGKNIRNNLLENL